MTEEWRQIPEWPLYEASSQGRVRRLAPGRGAVPGHVLGYLPSKSQYLFVQLRDGVGKHTVGAHQAVALAFIGPCPTGKEVGHKDHNPRHNVPDNLEYLTRLENVRQTVNAGRSNRGERHGHAKLTETMVLLIRRMAELKVPQQEIATQCGIAFQTVSHIVRRERWGWL